MMEMNRSEGVPAEQPNVGDAVANGIEGINVLSTPSFKSTSEVFVVSAQELKQMNIRGTLLEGGIILAKGNPEDVESIFETIAQHLTNLDIEKPGLSPTSGGPLLPWHVDGIYQQRISEIVCLGCHSTDSEGGITRFKDGRIIAQKLLEEMPTIEQATIRYERNHDPAKPIATWPVIAEFGGEKTLIYRANIPFFKSLEQTVLTFPEGIGNEAELYDVINSAVAEAPSSFAHEWTPGDVIIFNNRFYIHTRDAYTGYRNVERRRFDFPDEA